MRVWRPMKRSTREAGKAPTGLRPWLVSAGECVCVERMVNEGVSKICPTPRLFTLKNPLDPNERPCQQRFIEALQDRARRTSAVGDCGLLNGASFCSRRAIGGINRGAPNEGRLSNGAALCWALGDAASIWRRSSRTQRMSICLRWGRPGR